MFIEKLSLKNFKSFRECDLRFVKGFNAVVGPNGSGKCIRGDSKLLLADGQWVEIRQLVESQHAKYGSERLEDGLVSAVNPENLRVFSLNPTTLKVEPRRVHAFVKRSSPSELHEILLRSGRKIVSTGYHPLITLQEGKLQSLRADELKPGMFAAVPRKLQVDPSSFNPRLFLASQRLPLYVDGAPLLARLKSLKQASGKTWKTVSEEAAVSLHVLNGLSDGQAVPFHDALLLSRWLGLSDFEFSSLFERVKAKNSSKCVRIPSLIDERLARFLGYVISEGRSANNEIFFYNESPAILEDYALLCEQLFGIRPTACLSHGKPFLLLAGKPIVLLLEKVFGQKEFGHSRSKSVPLPLFSSPDSVIAAFLGGLFDGDGSVSISRKVCAEYTSASEMLVQGVAVLLNRLGFMARLRSSMKYASNTSQKSPRRYWRVFVYGADAVARMGGWFNFRHEEKRMRVETAGSLPSAATVDVIPEINDVLKTAFKESGFSDRKLKGVHPSRLRSYYENRAVPTRAGLLAAVQILQASPQTQWLQTLATSDVFWDEIVTISKVNGEEWVYDLCVDETHNFLAEGVFVHNTNIVDAVLFALGESRIRALRAKKAPDLIYKDARIAEAKLELRAPGSSERTWISRALRRDGKMRYTLNGKRSHRYVVEDYLRSHAVSTYNVIQQGEVQRIVEMSSKERRQLIDNIANVLEYEEKKKEALGELDKVEDKIREDSAKLAEKAGFLEQLRKDKEDAERFMALKGEAEQLKATLLALNWRELEVEFENAVNSVLDLRSKSEQLLRKANELQGKIDELQRKKDEINRKINERSEGKQLVLEREVEALKAEVERCRVLVQEKETEMERLQARLKELGLEKQRAGDEVKGVKARMGEVEQRLKDVKRQWLEEQGRLDRMLEASQQFSSGFFEARKEYERLQNEMLAAKEQLGALQAEQSTLQEVQKLKEEELKRLEIGQSAATETRGSQVENRFKEWKEKLAAEDASLQKLFSEEKKLNAELSELETEVTEAKIKVIETTTRLQNLREMELSQGVEYVLGQKGKVPGIHGTVEQLCTYDSKYAVPVQVALGGRLGFVVVDSLRVAEKLVEQLKARKLGRVSFIPLDRIRPYSFAPEEVKLKDHPGAVDFLVHLLEYEEKYAKAFQFVCGNTLLVKSLKEAEPLVGKARLVTEEGELVEPSALITGGSFSARINVKKEKEQLEEWDARLKKAKEYREQVLKHLYALQDEMSSARKRKADAEVQLKACELELQNLERTSRETEEKTRSVKSAAASLKKELKESHDRLQKLEEDRSALVRRLSDLNIASLEAKSKIDVEKEQRFGLELKEKEKRVSDLKFSLSDYSHQLESLQAQLKAFEREYEGLRKSEEELVKQQEEAKRVRKECKETVSKDEALLKEKLEALKGLSTAMQGLFEEREKIEAYVYQLANQKGKLEFEREKVTGELQKKEVAKAVAETNLANLKAEYEPFKDAKLLEIQDKPKLVLLSRQAEEEMQRLGNVNLKALEEYEGRAKDLEAQQEKVRQLANEKQAVLTMIQEIEGKKIATFMRSFTHVNDSFQKLFGQIFNGSGSLVLENPASPFEGGLTIKAQLEGKPVKYLELMSGGEKSLIAVLFLFAIQSYSPSSVYILDEADAALDQQNSLKLAELLKQLSKTTQFIVVTHNPIVYKHAEALVGVAMTKQGSRLVEVQLNEEGKEAATKAI